MPQNLSVALLGLKAGLGEQNNVLSAAITIAFNGFVADFCANFVFDWNTDLYFLGNNHLAGIVVTFFLNDYRLAAAGGLNFAYFCVWFDFNSRYNRGISNYS